MLLGQAVSDSGFGAQVPGAGWIRLELSTQLQHIDAQVVSLIAVVGTPYFPQELSMRNNLVGVSEQNFQQFVFDASEMDFSTLDEHAPLGEINFDLACTKNRGSGLACPTSKRRS